MKVDIPCQQGRLQVVADETLRLQQGWKTLWQVSCREVTQIMTHEGSVTFTPQEGRLRTFDLKISTTQGIKEISMVSRHDVAKLQACFPQIEMSDVHLWYKTTQAKTYTETYTDQADMNKEIKEASCHGWAVQNIAATKIPPGIGTFLLWGEIGFMAQAANDKVKLTLTFVSVPK